MRRPSYVVKCRSGIYYFRARMPSAWHTLRPDLPRELRVSTGTRNKREALVIARKAALGLQSGAIEILAQEFLRAAPASTTNAIKRISTPRLGRLLLESALASSCASTNGQRMRHAPLFNSWILVHDHGSGRTTLQSEPHDTPDTLSVGRQALFEMLEQQSERTAATATKAATTAEAHPVALPEAGSATGGAWLFEVMLKYRDFHLRRKLWQETTWTNTYEPILRICRELLSHETRDASMTDLAGEALTVRIADIRTSAITRSSVLQLSEDLLRFPKQHGKRRTSKDAKLILAGGGAAQSERNARKIMERFSTFLRWASNNGFLDAALADQAAELARGRDDVVGGAHAFDLPRLKRIFESDQYVSDRFRRAYQYWGPLIALFTAARIAEIANLSVDDFVEVDGIACIWFRGTALEFNGKTYERRVKTDAADRRVPLHPTLIELGLLDYVAVRRTAGAVLLFDGLTYSTKSQFSRNLGNWAQRYLKDVGVHEHRRFVFHSFRSTLGQQLDGTLRDVLIDRLVGHRGKTIRDRFYSTAADGAAAMPVEEVYAALSQADFGVTFHPTRRWSGQSWSKGRSR